ncbi:odorant receptor 43a-like isoform X1 [Cotesia glomerata]|uniref:odorant receptor 43a-like isoform X1 n=1 Tax=Cotesia glomerata TaxID=32391 RepID=UPI001D008022|nr:odorant receptor 43a-like isoform X1 [Cotesia glomerata]
MKLSASSLNNTSFNNVNTTTDKDVKWAVGLNRAVLKILGVWYYDNQSQWQTITSNFQTFIFVTGIFSFVTFPQTLALIKVWGDLTLIVDNLIVNLPITTCELKIFILWWHKKVLVGLFDEIEKDWHRVTDKSEKDIMFKYATISRIMTICGLCGAFFSLILYQGPLTFGIVLRTVTNLTDDPENLFSLQAMYFYDTSTAYSYQLTRISQIVGCGLSAVAYTSSDVLFGMIILHVCGQLEILASRVQAVADRPQYFSKLLREHIKNHVRLIRFTHDIEKVFSLMLLVLFGSVAITFCIQGFQFINVFTDNSIDLPITQMIFYIQFLSYCLFLTFVYSWVGENLVTQSQAVHTASCNCNWISCDSHEAKQIILMTFRSQNPLQITAGNLVPLTMNTFVQLLKTSGGYISFLLAVRE